MPSEFVHVHVHTEYSLLDGQSKIDKLLKRAKALEMEACAITDHGVMFGVIDFFRKAKDNDIKPILGMEGYIAPRRMTDKDARLDKKPFHLLLLARNMVGYKNLMQIASAAQLEGYYYRPRVDKDYLQDHADGLIATTGCLAAEIPRLVEEGKEDEARNLIGWYSEVFGPDNFFLELQPHSIDELKVFNRWLLDYRRSGHTPVQLVASNDVHYVLQSDWEAHDTLLCIQTGATKGEVDRMRMSPQTSYYLKSAEEMRAELAGVDEALIDEAFANTRRIAAMCDVDLSDKQYKLPRFPVPLGHDGGSYLRHLAIKGLSWRYPGREDDPVLNARIERELGIIGNMGFNTYFLIVWDLCQFARQADIWWNVRGSGAGSLVAYCLGITNIDPIQNNLLFERFLNPGRVSMPDIDMDFPDDRRGEMIAYTVEKYGEDKVAAIITFGTMGAKAAVKDVGRALDVPLEKVNSVAKLIPQEAKQKKIMEYVEADPELQAVYERDPQMREVFDAAKELQGAARHASMHAAGIIVADQALVNYVPLHRITGTDASGGLLKAVTQFPMETAESIGLLKIDFLGLSTLTILRKACDLIERHQHIKFTMDNIPYRHDDPRLGDEERRKLDQAFEMLGRGETVGVFQLESTGMQSMLRGMRPSRFEHVIAGISLYRPGPMDYIPKYNARMHGKEDVRYLHPNLQPILAETFGILVYQEQIMQVASDLFGYELGEADLMRRAVSKKKEKDLLKHKDIFRQRGPERGVDVEVAEAIFDEIEFFANYGFNKSHAADYAVITVQTAYLKCHFPEEYMTALLVVQFDDSTKVATFLAECRHLGIAILPPDVNASQLEFDIEPLAGEKRAIRFGLAAVKNAGVGALQRLIEERAAGGRFTSLEDFCQRVDLRQLGKRTLESLIKVGAFDAFGARDALAEQVDRLLNYSIEHHRAKDAGQRSLFGGMDGSAGASLSLMTTAKEPLTARQMLMWEKELLGLYVSGRPADRYLEQIKQAKLAVIADLKDPEDRPPNQKGVHVAGEVVAMRRLTTKSGDPMMIVQLEDAHESAALIEVVFFPRTWKQVQEKMKAAGQEMEEGGVIFVRGKLDTSREEVQIIADTVDLNLKYAAAAESPRQSSSANTDWMEGFDRHSSASEEPPLISEQEAQALVDEQGLMPKPAPNKVRPLVAPSDSPFGDLSSGKKSAALTKQQREVVVLFPYKEQQDVEQDRRRMKRVLGLLLERPGDDRFALKIYATPTYYKVYDYPEFKTAIDDELIEKLVSVVGSECVRVRVL